MIFLLLEIQGPQGVLFSIFDDHIVLGMQTILFSDIESFGTYSWSGTNFIVLLPKKPTAQSKTLAKLVFADNVAFERGKAVLAEKIKETPFEPTIIEYIGHLLKIA